MAKNKKNGLINTFFCLKTCFFENRRLCFKYHLILIPVKFKFMERPIQNRIIARWVSPGPNFQPPHAEDVASVNFLSNEVKLGNQISITFRSWKGALVLELPPCYTDYYRRLVNDNYQVRAQFDDSLKLPNKLHPNLFPLRIDSETNLHSLIPPPIGLTGNSIVDYFLTQRNNSQILCRKIVDQTTLLINDNYESLEKSSWKDGGILFTLAYLIRQYIKQFFEVPIAASFTELLIVTEVAKYLYRHESKNEEQKYQFDALIKGLENHCYNYLDAGQWGEMMSLCTQAMWKRFNRLGGYQQTYVDYKLKTKDRADKSFLIKDGIHRLGQQMNELHDDLYDFSLDEVHFEVLPMQANIGPTEFYSFLFTYCQMRALKMRLCEHYRSLIPGHVYDDSTVIEVFRKMRNKGYFELNKKECENRFLLLALYVKDEPPSKVKKELTDLLNGIPYYITENVLEAKGKEYWNELNRMRTNQPEKGDVAERMVYTFNKIYVEQFFLGKLAADAFYGKAQGGKPGRHWFYRLKLWWQWRIGRLKLRRRR